MAKISKLISIIMPTYNSQKTLPLALASVRQQTLPASQIEILIIDGGSTDATLEIAREFKVTIINNPQRLSEPAKRLGLQNATGDYGMFLDSDEVLLNPQSLARRLAFLQAHSQVKNIAATSLITPPHSHIATRYTNEIGDPFSFFVYNYDNQRTLYNYQRRYHTETFSDGYIFYFKQSDLLPICDGGSHFFDLAYLRDHFDLQNPAIGAQVFDLLANHTHSLAILQNDFVMHYTSANYRTVLAKIRTRIINNLFSAQTSGAGFANRHERLPLAIRCKKYLFLPYACLIIPSLIDNLVKTIIRMNTVYLLNFIFSVITGYLIVYYYLIHLFCHVENKSSL